MAQFEVHALEGTHYVTAQLQNEIVRAESGAFCYMVGNIEIHAPYFTGPLNWFRTAMAGESLVRPTYKGTGSITFESSMAGFSVLQLEGHDWILRPGAYWASDGAITVTYHRETILTSLWAGEGLIWLQTRVRGNGNCVINTPGPVDEVKIDPNERLVAESPYVIARTSNTRLRVRRLTKNFLGRFTAQEPLVNEYSSNDGMPCRVKICAAPYWRQFILSERLGARLQAR